MSPTANVRAIRSLEDLKGALGRFGGEAREALQAADREIRRTLDWLQERLNYWQREVEQCQRAYDACMRSRDRDGRGPSCNAEAAALRRAQAELTNVRRWLAQVQQVAGSYHVQARRLQNLATVHTEKAQAFLGRKIGDLEQYVALASGVAMLGPPLLNAVRSQYQMVRSRVGQQAVRLAKQQEVALVQKTHRGTRDWSRLELRQLKSGQFPKGYHGHHINNVARFPDLADNPDNIRFVTPQEHKRLHHWKWSNTSGKMFNRKSLMVQWARYK